MRLELLTPTFNGGDNQEISELRVPSIRGAIRWWFRFINDDQSAEQEVFGGIGTGGAVSAKASAVLIRIKNIDKGTGTSCAPNNQFFAGRTKECYPAGTTFELEVRWKRKIEASLVEQFNAALKLFITLGSIGARSNRGCGSLGHADSEVNLVQLTELSNKYPHISLLIPKDWKFSKSQKDCVTILEAYTKQLQKETGCRQENKDAMGWAIGQSRQSSSMKYKVIKLKEGLIPLVHYCDDFMSPGVKSIESGLDINFFCHEVNKQYQMELI